MTQLQLKQLIKESVRQVIRENEDTNYFSPGNWAGADRDLETSLLEYGFICKPTGTQGEYIVVYESTLHDMKNPRFSVTYVKEADLDSIVLGHEWADSDDIRRLLDYMGLDSADAFIEQPFVHKLSPLLAQLGWANILGEDYTSGHTIEEINEKLQLNISDDSIADYYKNLGFKYTGGATIEEPDQPLNESIKNKFKKLANIKKKNK